MKIRVCAKCGKHNLENTWECEDCGETLSINTIMDTEKESSSSISIASQPTLSGISSYFGEDLAAVLKANILRSESVILGCNVAQFAKVSPFPFGYFVLTSRKIICVLFECEVKRNKASALTSLFSLLHFFSFLIKEAAGYNELPIRPCFGDRSGALAVDYPKDPLTSKEMSSRKMTVYELEKLISIDLTDTSNNDIILMNLAVKFRPNDEVKVTFYAPHQAETVYKYLATRFRKK